MTGIWSNSARRFWLLGGVSASCLLMTWLVSMQVGSWSDELEQSRFNEAAHLRVQLIVNELASQLNQIDSLQRFIAQNPTLSARDYRQLVRLDAGYDITVAWLEHVPADELGAYLERMRQEFGSDFSFRRPGAIETDRPADRYFPITYSIASDAGSDLVGVDPSRLPGRLEAMIQAAQTRRLVMVTGLAILTDLEDMSGSLTFAPVFNLDAESTGDDVPWGSLRGFVGYGLRLSTLLEQGNFNPETGGQDIYFELARRMGSDRTQLLFSQFNDRAALAPAFVKEFSIAGQDLILRARPVAGHRAISSYPAVWIWVVGLILTFLLVGIVRVLLNRSERVQSEVADKTQALNAALAMERQTSVSLQGVLNAAERVAIIATEPEGLIRIFNIGAENILGYRAEEMVGQCTPLRFHDPVEVEQERQRLMTVLGRTVKPFEVFTVSPEHDRPTIWTYIRRDGERRRVRLMVTPIRLSEDRIDGYLGVAVDITKQLVAERELVQAGKLLEALTRNVPGVVYRFRMDVDGQMSFPYASDGIYEIYGISAEQARESAQGAIDRIHPDDLEDVIASIKQSAAQLTRWRSDYRVVLPMRGVRWLRGESTPERCTDGATIWHGYLADITELKELEQKLRDEAAIDPLTGLQNRRQLQVQGAAALDLFRRTGEPFSLIMLDLDHFKAVNDRYGHDMGDEVLRRVSRALSHGVRTSDTVIRMGGEELLVFCRNADLAGVVPLAESMREQIQCLTMPFDAKVTASFGVAAIHAGEDLSDLMKRADELLYQAKQSGRNRVEY